MAIEKSEKNEKLLKALEAGNMVSLEKTTRMGTVFVPETKIVCEKDEQGNIKRDEQGHIVALTTKERPAMTAVRDDKNEIVRDENGKAQMTERKDKDGNTVMIKPRAMIRLDSGDFTNNNDGAVTLFVGAGQVKPLTENQEKMLRAQAEREGHKYRDQVCVVLPSNRDSYDVVLQKVNEDNKTYTMIGGSMTRDQFREAVKPNGKINFKPTGKTWEAKIPEKGEKSLDEQMDKNLALEDIVPRENKSKVNTR